MEINNNTKPIHAYSNALQKVCPNLSAEELHFMCSKVTVTNLKANIVYLKAGEIQQSVGFSFKGLLRRFSINDKGEEITIDFIKENNYATDYGAFLNQKPSNYYIETLEPCLLINVPFTSIQECYSKFKNCEQYGRLIAENHLNKVQNRMNSFLFNTAEQRYINFVSKNKDILNRISITHLSSFLGIKRQTLTRIRKKLIQSI